MVFYAYITNIEDDNSWREVLIFQDSATADEWWRAVSGGNTLLKDLGIQRVAPQLYTHRPNSAFNCYNFFIDSRIADIANPFRGRLIITSDNDRGGRGISIIPPQNVTDLVSGNWFFIRSKSIPSAHWYYDPSTNNVYASDTKRTLFCVTAQGLPAKTIIIGSDRVALSVAASVGSQLNIGIDYVGSVGSVCGPMWSFTFRDLADGRFVSRAGGMVFENIDAGAPKKEGWELV